MRDALIVAAVRTPVGKAPRGALRYTRPDELMAVALRAALDRAPGMAAGALDDVIVGCAMPEAEQGLNVARIASLRAGIPVAVPALTVNRFCASGLEAIAIGAERIRCGSADAVLAGGVESMSLVPMGGHVLSPNPALVNDYPDVYLTTGLVAENHAREHGISRSQQDEYALQSHHRAIEAIDAGRFDAELVPVPVRYAAENAPGRPDVQEGTLAIDEGPRRETSAEALARLVPSFMAGGTVTAGNSSQRSDGAAAVLLVAEPTARALGLTPLARFAGYATAGVEPERFGIGPVPAMRRLLERTGVALRAIDLIELNEAFAAQVLACARELDLDRDRLNVNGGAIALGHPLGCSGARITATLLHEMERRSVRYGAATLCVGGGMGAAALYERA
jgi:acetyl-CoA acyltransferase